MPRGSARAKRLLSLHRAVRAALPAEGGAQARPPAPALSSGEASPGAWSRSRAADQASGGTGRHRALPPRAPRSASPSPAPPPPGPAPSRAAPRPPAAAARPRQPPPRRGRPRQSAGGEGRGAGGARTAPGGPAPSPLRSSAARKQPWLRRRTCISQRWLRPGAVGRWDLLNLSPSQALLLLYFCV